MKALRRIALGVAPAAALIVISGWDVVATLRARQERIGAQAWRGAEKALRQGYAPGDLIVFSPRYFDPLGRQHVGDLIPLDVAGRMDSATFGRIWELSADSGRHPETVGLAISWEKRFGALRLRRYRQKTTRVSTDFVRSLTSARREGAHLRAPVVDLASIAFEARRCVRLVVDTAGAARIVYPGALLGERIVGYVGLVDEFPRLRKKEERGRLRLLIDGKSAAEIDVTGRWTRFAAKTSPDTRAEVVFEVSASGPTRPPRQICFAAQARR